MVCEVTNGLRMVEVRESRLRFMFCTRCAFCPSLGKRRAVKECAESQWISYPCFQMAAVSLLNLFSFSLRRKLFLSFRWWRKCETVEMWNVDKGRNRDESRWRGMTYKARSLMLFHQNHKHARTHTHARESQLCSKGARTWGDCCQGKSAQSQVRR